LPEALELARKAASLEPADLSHRINIGRILLMMDKDNEAYATAVQVMAIAKSDADRGEAESLLFAINKRRETSIEENRRAEAIKQEFKKMEEGRARDKELEEQIRAQAAMRQEAAAPAPVKTGAALKASGIIRSVKCDYPAVMDVVLDENGKLQKLHADNYYQVEYWAVGSSGKNGFEPCDELAGSRVEIEFLTVAGQDYSGLIKTVAITK
jgi:hypothetical protein